jgi:acyl carrier protein
MSAPHLDPAITEYIAPRRELTGKVKTCLVDGLMLDLAPEEIGLDSPFFGSGLGLDSVDALGIAASLEQAFGIEILDSDINLFRSVNATVDFIMEKKRIAPPAGDSPEAAAPPPGEEAEEEAPADDTPAAEAPSEKSP